MPPKLMAAPGVAELTAAKIVTQTADVRRFRSKDACARHNGTAPLPIWSGNQIRHRLSRTGKRRLSDITYRAFLTDSTSAASPGGLT